MNMNHETKAYFFFFFFLFKVPRRRDITSPRMSNHRYIVLIAQVHTLNISLLVISVFSNHEIGLMWYF